MYFSTSWEMKQSNLEPLRVGCIGVGAMAEFAVYPAMYHAPIALQAICDIDEKRANYLAGKFGSVRSYTDYKNMFANEDMEAVIVQMHPKLRYEIVIDALEEGYHVFIPKPPAMTSEETINLANTSSRMNRYLMVNFESRFSFGVTQAKKILDSKEFGTLTQYHSSFCSGRYSGEDDYRSKDYENAVQAYLLDFSIHHLDLARYIAGEISKMSLFHNQQGETGAFALALEFDNGAVGTLQLNSNRLWWRNYDRIELTGEGEYIILDSLWKLKHFTKEQNTFSENYRDERNGELTGDAGSFREFVDAIRSGREPVSGIQDCVHTMQLYQNIYNAVNDDREGVIFEKQS